MILGCPRADRAMKRIQPGHRIRGGGGDRREIPGFPGNLVSVGNSRTRELVRRGGVAGGLIRGFRRNTRLPVRVRSRREGPSRTATSRRRRTAAFRCRLASRMAVFFAPMTGKRRDSTWWRTRQQGRFLLHAPGFCGRPRSSATPQARFDGKATAFLPLVRGGPRRTSGDEREWRPAPGKTGLPHRRAETCRQTRRQALTGRT